jgi:hypothetical protein
MKKTDRIVVEIVDKFQQRSEVGIRKYNTTLEENNKDNFFVHLQEELMDATLYLQKLMSLNIELTKLVSETPNDAELGQKIRRLVR